MTAIFWSRKWKSRTKVHLLDKENIHVVEFVLTVFIATDGRLAGACEHLANRSRGYISLSNDRAEHPIRPKFCDVLVRRRRVKGKQCPLAKSAWIVQWSQHRSSSTTLSHYRYSTGIRTQRPFSVCYEQISALFTNCGIIKRFEPTVFTWNLNFLTSE